MRIMRPRPPWTPPRARYLAVAFLLFAMLNAFDALVTIVLVDRGGFELNPLMRMILGFSPAAFFLIKHLLGTVGVAILCMMAGHRRSAWISMLALTAVYAAVCASNAYCLTLPSSMLLPPP